MFIIDQHLSSLSLLSFIIIKRTNNAACSRKLMQASFFCVPIFFRCRSPGLEPFRNSARCMELDVCCLCQSHSSFGLSDTWGRILPTCQRPFSRLPLFVGDKELTLPTAKLETFGELLFLMVGGVTEYL